MISSQNKHRIHCVMHLTDYSGKLDSKLVFWLNSTKGKTTPKIEVVIKVRSTDWLGKIGARVDFSSTGTTIATAVVNREQLVELAEISGVDYVEASKRVDISDG